MWLNCMLQTRSGETEVPTALCGSWELFLWHNYFVSSMHLIMVCWVKVLAGPRSTRCPSPVLSCYFFTKAHSLQLYPVTGQTKKGRIFVWLHTEAPDATNPWQNHERPLTIEYKIKSLKMPFSCCWVVVFFVCVGFFCCWFLFGFLFVCLFSP